MNSVFGGSLLEGKVKYLSPDKRWGFVTADISKEDYYVSNSGIMDTNLAVGDRVRFELVKGSRGLEAYEVRKLRT